MTYAQDLDTGELYRAPRAEAISWCLQRLGAGHRPYLSETRIPDDHAAYYRDRLARDTDEWSV